jgi:hypothetical protein
MAFKLKWIDINHLNENPNNPRVIEDRDFDALCESIRSFPKMLELRPIVVNDKMVPLGGNMRLRACKKVGVSKVPVLLASDLTDNEQRQFIITDNVSRGKWDWDALRVDWDVEELEKWGVELPALSETEKISLLEFEDVYYEPKHIPDLKLSECLNLDKFKSKIEAIEKSDLTNEQKELMKFFAYRFIKIDFENVANYYFFNASDPEKKIIERLRLVLCDNGVNGFIEDDMLRIHQLLDKWSDDND